MNGGKKMVKRTTISIPDKLYQKMEQWRHEINFSKEFQTHIESIIERKERLKQGMMVGVDMTRAIERLKEEKRKSGISFFDDGKKYGFRWAANSHYDDIQAAIAWNDLRAASRCESIQELIQAVFEEDPSGLMGIEDDKHSSEYFNEYALSFFKGFKEGVTEFWAQVEDYL